MFALVAVAVDCCGSPRQPLPPAFLSGSSALMSGPSSVHQGPLHPALRTTTARPRRRTLACRAARRCMLHLLRMTDEGSDEDLLPPALSDAGFQEYLRKAPQRLLTHLREGSLHGEDGRVLTKKHIIELEQLQNFPYVCAFECMFIHHYLFLCSS